MAETKIDPGFQAAPYLGGSSYDPIQAVKENKAQWNEIAIYKLRLQQQKEAEGLKAFDMDIKGWEDQKGSDELINELSDLRSQYIEIGRQGMNLTRPTTVGEQQLSKAFNTRLMQLKQKHDVWQRNKLAVDTYNKIANEEKKKPIDQQSIDWAAGGDKLKEYFNGEGGILERSKLLENIIIPKYKSEDIGKYIAEQMKAFLPEEDVIQQPIAVDPVTGKVTTTTTKSMDPKKVNSAINKITYNIKDAPEGMRRSIENAYDIDKKENETLSEWMKRRYLKEFATEKRTTMSGGSGKGGLAINFLGKKTTMSGAVERNDPVYYGTGEKGKSYTHRYEFNTNDVFTVPIGPQGAEVYNMEEWQPYPFTGNIEAKLLFYDPDRDEFVFRVAQSSDSPPVERENTISIPRSNLGGNVDDLPIETDGGIKPFKDVFGPTVQPKKKIEGLDKTFASPSQSSEEEKKKKKVTGKDFTEQPMYIFPLKK